MKYSGLGLVFTVAKTKGHFVSPAFVIQICGVGVVVIGVVVCRRHTLYSGQYLKNGLSDLIQIWHMDVTGPGGVLYSFVTLNSH